MLCQVEYKIACFISLKSYSNQVIMLGRHLTKNKLMRILSCMQVIKAKGLRRSSALKYFQLPKTLQQSVIFFLNSTRQNIFQF